MHAYMHDLSDMHACMYACICLSAHACIHRLPCIHTFPCDDIPLCHILFQVYDGYSEHSLTKVARSVTGGPYAGHLVATGFQLLIKVSSSRADNRFHFEATYEARGNKIFTKRAGHCLNRRGSRGGVVTPPLLSTTNFFFNKLFNYSKKKTKKIAFGIFYGHYVP